MKTTRLKIKGMDCASCVVHIEKALQKTEGVKEVSLNFATETGQIIHDPGKIKEADLISIIQKTGYGAESLDANEMKMSHDHGHHGGMEDHSAHAMAEDEMEVRKRLIKVVFSAVLTVAILSLGFVWKMDYSMELMMVLTTIILAYSGKEFFVRGIPSLLRGMPGMDTLVAIGVGAAFLFSSYNTLFTSAHEEYFMDAALITTFILLGRYLEARAKGKASQAIKKLLALSPKIAHRVNKDGSIEEIPSGEVKVDDILLVKPGESIPVDGILIEDFGTLDEAMVTGESIPVDKKPGDPVIGGTLNTTTTFKIKAEKIGSETVLAQIIKTVEEAQMSKAPIQKLADVISGYFVWGVLAVALLTLILWLTLTEAGSSKAFVTMVAVLIIACPCALGLATPISIVVGSGKGASMGILIKRTESLEKAHKVTTMVFDKTGTLTEGKPAVQEYKHFSGEEVANLNIAYALESHSEHPLAQSIVTFVTGKQSISKMAVTDFEAKVGEGVSARVEGEQYFFGSLSYILKQITLNPEEQKLLNQLEEKGDTLLLLADESNLLAVFGVQDKLKPTSAKAIKKLKEKKIRTIMMTGDREKVAKHIAEGLEIDEIHAQVGPIQKKELIESLQKEGQFVAMVGDGINDSPALAQADVGIAMGTGTDIAMETGDLILVKGDLMKATEAIELSRATLRNIKQNLFWAFVYNTVGIPIAAFGLLNPAYSAIAMALSSITVVLNALRLRSFEVK